MQQGKAALEIGIARTSGPSNGSWGSRSRHWPPSTARPWAAASKSGSIINYRTISKSPGGCDHYALPECFLGLVPGWGGTQLVTKLCGPEAAIELIISNPLNMNKMINSKKAFEMGLADKLIAPAEFMDESLALLERIITGEEKIERKKVDPKMSDELYNKTKADIVGRVHSGALSPLPGA